GGHALEHILKCLLLLGVGRTLFSGLARFTALTGLAALAGLILLALLLFRLAPGLGDLLPAGADTLLDAVALHLLNLFEPLLEVFQHRANVVAVQLLLAHALEALDEVSDAGHLLAVRPVHTPAEEPLQGALQVTI